MKIIDIHVTKYLKSKDIMEMDDFMFYLYLHEK